MNALNTYEIRVVGHLAAHWQARFAPLTLTLDPCGETVLTGRLDQAALHGVLAQMRDLGLKIVALNAISAPDNTPDTNA